ncbi:1-acyl-sn-glycerol-3-phosphate acyltransferase [Colwellia sp. D2M02]|uniref:lysophospholipid acyltransferase family protein n=1 Tax=Colwellia sp. D2M02 TaxID=2841562 RepID=UPI001C09C751|nr:lysophospholipid acyltransferase family protein [Colwellia sp. D2M02]MBU2894727.1 1-acyl-sn-glycerol-3-phosphate acyltransferase [Colwellia sp. D2M02]
MNRLLKILFFALVVKPVVFFCLGLNVFFKARLPRTGAAIIVANHNSHLDTMVLMSLYPLLSIHRIRPVAAADYFLSNRFLAWFSLNIIGIIPIKRRAGSAHSTLFDECHNALNNGDILVLFPEGSRGAPEQMSELKRGVHHLIKSRPTLNVAPVFLHGLGRALPKGEALLVPFNCDVVIGEPIAFVDDAKQYIHNVGKALSLLEAQCLTRQCAVTDDQQRES